MPIYSVKEAANRLELSERWIRKLLEDGRMKGKKLARDWVIYDLDYVQFLRGKDKKPRKKGVRNETDRIIQTVRH